MLTDLVAFPETVMTILTSSCLAKHLKVIKKNIKMAANRLLQNRRLTAFLTCYAIALFEPSHSKRNLSAMRFEILQTHIRSHSTEPEMWLIYLKLLLFSL